MTGPDDDARDAGLDAELRALFADERLALPVSATIEHAVLAGARRRHQRRLAVGAAGGVVVVAVLVFVASTLTGVARGPADHTVPVADRPLLSQTSEPTTTPDPFRTVRAANVLGPNGFGGLTMGTSSATMLALANDLDWRLSYRGRTGDCDVYDLLISQDISQPPNGTVDATSSTVPLKFAIETQQRLAVQVTISPMSGVVQIGGVGFLLHTPQGVDTGTTERALRAVYLHDVTRVPVSNLPTVAGGVPRYADRVDVPEESPNTYLFAVTSHGNVVGIWLRVGLTLPC